MTEPLEIYIKFTVTSCNGFKHNHFLQKSKARGNSLLEFIFQCEENGVRDLILFGADGFADKGTPYHYPGHPDHCRDVHIRECSHFNANFPKELKLNIFNVIAPETKSYYAHLKEISYDEVLATFPDKKKI